MQYRKAAVSKPPRIVNDTNIWLSALYFSGNEAKIVHQIEEGIITSVTSDFILQELKEKMIMKFETPFFAANGTISYISSLSELVPLKGKNFNLRDPADNKILETAVVGKCNWLVTGDKDLLSAKKYQDIKIVNAVQFLDNY